MICSICHKDKQLHVIERMKGEPERSLCKECWLEECKKMDIEKDGSFQSRLREWLAPSWDEVLD